MKKPKNSDRVPTGKPLRITETYLQEVRPPSDPDARVFIRDGNPPGFGVSITSNGARSFVLDYRIFNRNRRITLGRWPEMTLQEARDAATAARRDVGQNHDPLLSKHQSRELRTVHDLAIAYLQNHAERYKRPASVTGDRATLATIIRPRLGNLAVIAVTNEHVAKLHRDLAETPYRANRVLALLSKMFNLAIVWNRENPVWRSDNPAKGIKKYPEEKRRRWLDKKEIGRLLTVLDGYAEQKTANALRMILLTGARKGEALAAKWDDIDFKNRLWRKPSAHTKQKREEFVPLSSDAVKLLERMREKRDGEFLFPGRVNVRPLEDLKTHWSAIRKAAGLPGVRIHDLRHTYASHLVSIGVPLYTVGTLLGHTQSSTTERYAHVGQEPQRAAAEKFGAIFRHAKKTKTAR